MKRSQRSRRLGLVFVCLVSLTIFVMSNREQWSMPAPEAPVELPAGTSEDQRALTVLGKLEVKGRAPKTGYARSQFGNGWTSVGGCDTRNTILARDLDNFQTNQLCQVVSGDLNDPYTGEQIKFIRGPETSQDVQIDHVVALSNAWQTGAQQLDESARIDLANDPLNLLAVKGSANQTKSDGDTATWLPANKPFRCQYVARQIAVKFKYQLWVVPPEKAAMERVLESCPNQLVPG